MSARKWMPRLDTYALGVAGTKAIEQMEREKPTDWANWLAGEGTIAAGLAGGRFGELIATEYASIQSGDGEARR